MVLETESGWVDDEGSKERFREKQFSHFSLKPKWTMKPPSTHEVMGHKWCHREDSSLGTLPLSYTWSCGKVQEAAVCAYGLRHGPGMDWPPVPALTGGPLSKSSRKPRRRRPRSFRLN